LKLKRIKGNKIRKFYWNKKIFNVKKLGAATSKYNKKKICSEYNKKNNGKYLKKNVM